MNDLLVPLVVVSEVALIGLVIWVVARRIEQKAQLRAELHLKLLERFGSVQELEQFLASDTGRQVLGLYSAQSRPPLARIIGTAQVGVALLVLGLGVISVGPVAGGKMPLVAGAVVTALGVGLLAATAVARRLSKTWGL